MSTTPATTPPPSWWRRLVVWTLLLIVLFAAFLGACKALGWWVWSDGGFFGSSQTQAQQTALADAAQTDVGHQLMAEGYSPVRELERPKDNTVIDFVNDQIRTYRPTEPSHSFILFSQGKPEGANPDDPSNPPPDLIYDEQFGFVLAVSQDFSDGRGMLCLSPTDRDGATVVQYWLPLAKSQWGQSLGTMPRTIGREIIPGLPDPLMHGVTCILPAA